MAFRYRCARCRFTFDRYLLNCAECGAHASVALCGSGKKTGAPVSSAPPEARDPLAIGSILDAPKLPDVRMKTNINGVDEVLGGGFEVPSAVMFYGGPGCGKSSLVLPIAAKSDAERPLVVSTEELTGKILRRAERFGLSAADCARVKCMGLPETEDMEWIMPRIVHYNPDLILFDSLSKARRPGTSGINTLGIDTRHKQQNILDILTILRKDQQLHGRVLLVISHMNKEEEAAGLMELTHDVDTAMNIEIVPRSKIRKLHCPKNRGGSDSTFAMFAMMPNGLVELQDNNVVEKQNGTVVRIHTPEGDPPLAATGYVVEGSSGGVYRDKF